MSESYATPEIEALSTGVRDVPVREVYGYGDTPADDGVPSCDGAIPGPAGLRCGR